MIACVQLGWFALAVALAVFTGGWAYARALDEGGGMETGYEPTGSGWEPRPRDGWRDPGVSADPHC